jgi:hypothetical protein
MTRFLLDTGIAGDFIDRRRGVFEKNPRFIQGSALEFRTACFGFVSDFVLRTSDL